MGHGLGLGHITEDEGIALMGYNPDRNIYYVPQSLDIGLMSQVYPYSRRNVSVSRYAKSRKA